MTASDGGIFAFGSAPFEGSLGGTPLHEPVVGIARPAERARLLAGCSRRRRLRLRGRTVRGIGRRDRRSRLPAVGIAGRPGGYWLAYGVDPKTQMISSIAAFVATRADNVTVAVQDLTTNQIYQFRPGVTENTASTLKVDILATLLGQAQAAGRAAHARGTEPGGADDRGEPRQCRRHACGPGSGPAAVGAFERAEGMTSTVPATDGVWGSTQTTALDRLAMIRTVVQPNTLLDGCLPGLHPRPDGEHHPFAGLGCHGGRPAGRDGGPQERIRHEHRMADQHHRVGRRWLAVTT